jgi:hypothetical protein
MTAAPLVALAPILAAGLVWGQFVPDSTLQSAQTHEIRPIRSAELGRLLFSEHRLRRFTSTEVVYGVTGTGVTELPEYGVSP